MYLDASQMTVTLKNFLQQSKSLLNFSFPAKTNFPVTMSTDTEDANFDETLKNLELLSATIATTGSDHPSGASAIANPFQVPDLSAEHLLQRNEAIVKQIFGARCECGAERGSGPVGCHKSSTSAQKQHGSLEHGIINPTPFKHKIKGEKKVIVREAILKNIGKCVHQNLVKQNNLSKELTKQQQRLSNTFLPAPTPLKPSRSENNLSNGFNQDAGDDILDFRLLVAQCSELTLSNGSKPTDGPNFSRNSFKTLRQTDIFGSSSHSHSPMTFIGPSRRNRRARQLKRYNSTSSLESDSSSSGNGGGNVPTIGSSNNSIRTPPHHSSHPQHQQSLQQSPNSSSTSPTASSSSSSASCSTQARLNGSSMPCDITIDEMASYFETLVHIPKKMSSMAEMMYI